MSFAVLIDVGNFPTYEECIFPSSEFQVVGFCPTRSGFIKRFSVQTERIGSRALMEWKPRADLLGARHAEGWPSFEGSYASEVDPGAMAAERTARGYHICLECVLPLKTPKQDHIPECRCPLAEEVEDSGWHFGDVEAVMLIWVGIVCVIMCCLAWF